MKEMFISKSRRDARYQELRAQGRQVRRRSLRNQRLHPQYIQDAAEEGIRFQVGFGNTDYLRSWSVLYTLEAPRGGTY